MTTVLACTLRFVPRFYLDKSSFDSGFALNRLNCPVKVDCVHQLVPNFSFIGAKVHISSTRIQVICSDGKSFETKAAVTTSSSGFSAEAVQLLEHAKECLQRCKTLETCVSQHESNSESLFPIIVSRRPSNATLSKGSAALGRR